MNRKVNYRGAKEEPSWLRDNDDFEVTETALEETELGANTGDEEEGEVIEHSDLASLPIIEDESINYDSERGSAVKASFREDGSVEERKQPRPPKGSIEVARGQHQFFCREDFLLRFEIHRMWSFIFIFLILFNYISFYFNS